MSERWLPVLGYEGYYEVSDAGRVRSVDRSVKRIGRTTPVRLKGKLLKASLSSSSSPGGHRLVVRLCRGEGGVSKLVPHLVLDAFVGQRPDGTECCHWDDDHTNNNLSNLRWDTRSANRADRTRNGRDPNAKKTSCVHGHEFTPTNTYIRPVGGRDCRRCMADRHRARKAARAGELQI